MLSLGIDRHKRQLTVNLRGEDGAVILNRQVSFVAWGDLGRRPCRRPAQPQLKRRAGSAKRMEPLAVCRTARAAASTLYFSR